MEFVTYEIAKKLKEKGFKEGCIKYFNANKALVWCTSPWLLMDFNNYISDPSRISAPTIFQTLKWLRKEKKIHITVPYEKEGFYFCIKQIDCDLIYNLIQTKSTKLKVLITLILMKKLRLQE